MYYAVPQGGECRHLQAQETLSSSPPVRVWAIIPRSASGSKASKRFAAIASAARICAGIAAEDRRKVRACLVECCHVLEGQSHNKGDRGTTRQIGSIGAPPGTAIGAFASIEGYGVACGPRQKIVLREIFRPEKNLPTQISKGRAFHTLHSLHKLHL